MLGWFSVVDLTELGVLLTAVFGGFTALLVAVFKFVKDQGESARKERDEAQKINAATLKELTRTLNANTESNKEIAAATTKAAREAEQRNGHLAELALEGQKASQQHQRVLIQMADRNYKAITSVKEQHVQHQTVASATIKEEHVEHAEIKK